MGKAGNKARRVARRQKEARRHASLDENIQAVLAEDAQLQRKESVEQFMTDNPEYQSSFEKVYGKPGPPNDNVVFLGAPPKGKKKVVDILGRVREVDDTLDSVRKVMAKHTSDPAPVSETKAEGRRRVTICRDHVYEYPELYMEIFVAPDPSVRDDEARFAQMFARTRSSRAKSVLESDLVIFAGGSDVDPILYGEPPHASTYFNQKRDNDDIALYLLCLEHGIPMMGVCRGAQFLHVMNGGKLYQDIDGHMGNHKMWSFRDKAWIDKVSSVHHQSCIPNKEGGMELLACANKSTRRWLNNEEKESGKKMDVEAFFYRDTCCIGVQGHPEYAGYPQFTKWCLDLVNDLVLCSPDIEWRDGQRRLKQEFINERNGLKPSIKDLACHQNVADKKGNN